MFPSTLFRCRIGFRLFLLAGARGKFLFLVMLHLGIDLINGLAINCYIFGIHQVEGLRFSHQGVIGKIGFPARGPPPRDTLRTCSVRCAFSCRSPWQPRSWPLPPSPIRHRVVVPAGCGPQRLPGVAEDHRQDVRGAEEGRHPEAAA